MENKQKYITNNFGELKALDLESSSKSNLRLDSPYAKTSRQNKKGRSIKYNKTLFQKIKKLITEFEKEQNEKDKSKSKSKKKIKNKAVNIIQKIKNNTKTSNIDIIPNKKIFYNVPKIKSQMQFNRYLINDFKENDSEADYIKRSKKYQKINEDFDELILMKQIKEVAKNGIFENITEEKYNEPEFIYESPESEKRSNNSLKPYFNKNVSDFGGKNNNNLRNSINAFNMNINLKRYYTEKIKEIPKNLGKNERRKESIFNNNNTNNKDNNSNDNVIKIKEKENIHNNINNTNKSTGIKYLMNIKNKNNNNINNTEINSPKKSPKKKKIALSLDKFAFSNSLYITQKKDYIRYIRKKQYMRGKNFSKQIALINKEKEKFGVTEGDESNTEGGLPKLKIPNLLFQIQYKDIFKNSFNTLRVFEEGDQDLDLDDLTKIKNSIKDYEIEMIKVLKKNNNLNYIKKRFNKTTVGKFQSTKGIYFGS